MKPANILKAVIEAMKLEGIEILMADGREVYIVEGQDGAIYITDEDDSKS